MKQPAIPPGAIKHAPSGWLSARQGAGKKLRRGTGLICEKQFFEQRRIATKRGKRAIREADARKSGFLEVPQSGRAGAKNVGWIKRAARIHQSAETIHWWKRYAFSTLH